MLNYIFLKEKQKNTNKVQLEKFIAALEANPYVIKDKHKASQSFWVQLATELNTFGPQTKDGSGWKKVKLHMLTQ